MHRLWPGYSDEKSWEGDANVSAVVLVVLAVMAALLIYAACCVDGDIDRQSEAHPPKPEKGRDDGKV